MTRLAKGAKETFGWVVVAADRRIVIPPSAWERYGFQAGQEAIFIPGSKKSGGFGLTNRKLLEGLSIFGSENQILGSGEFSANREVCIPENIPVNPGDRLLTAFGSGNALGMISHGPIYEEAIKHPELEEYKVGLK